MGCGPSNPGQVEQEPITPLTAQNSKSEVQKHIVNVKTAPLDITEDTRHQEIDVEKRIQRLNHTIVNHNTELDIKDYYDIESDVLGAGMSGSVRVCKHLATGGNYAVKTFTKKKVEPEKVARLREEIQFMIHLDHPNILRLIETFENEDTIYLISDICSGGEMRTHWKEHANGRYSEAEACRYIHTMLHTISYCHAHNIVHRDLKLENFLFENTSSDAEIILIDFGLSQYFAPGEVLHDAVGTPDYVAPEVLAGNGYTEKCDVWSIGIITYLLLNGAPPFDGHSDEETLELIKIGRWKFNDEVFDNVSTHCKDFITQLLNKRPGSRPTTAKALEHPWFRMLQKSTKSVINRTSADYLIKHMIAYENRTALAKVCLEALSYTLYPTQLNDLRRYFYAIDSTQNISEINLFNFKNAVEAFVETKDDDNLNSEDIKRVFEKHPDGRLSYHEFLATVISKFSITEINLQLAFEKITNHSEFFTWEDILDLLGGEANISIDAIETMFAEENMNAETEITFEDFKALILQGDEDPNHQPTEHKRRLSAALVHSRHGSDNAMGPTGSPSLALSIIPASNNNSTPNLVGPPPISTPMMTRQQSGARMRTHSRHSNRTPSNDNIIRKSFHSPAAAAVANGSTDSPSTPTTTDRVSFINRARGKTLDGTITSTGGSGSNLAAVAELTGSASVATVSNVNLFNAMSTGCDEHTEGVQYTPKNTGRAL